MHVRFGLLPLSRAKGCPYKRRARVTVMHEDWCPVRQEDLWSNYFVPSPLNGLRKKMTLIVQSDYPFAVYVRESSACTYKRVISIINEIESVQSKKISEVLDQCKTFV